MTLVRRPSPGKQKKQDGDHENGSNQRFKETVVDRVKSDPAFPEALLDEAVKLSLHGEPDTAKLVLRDLVNATAGFETLARDLHKSGQSVQRMLSASGNPTMAHFSSMIHAVRNALRVQIKATVVPV